MSKVVNSKYVEIQRLFTEKGWYQSKQYITGIDCSGNQISRNGLLDYETLNYHCYYTNDA